MPRPPPPPSRQWGTRFDAIHTQPPPSPSLSSTSALSISPPASRGVVKLPPPLVYPIADSFNDVRQEEEDDHRQRTSSSNFYHRDGGGNGKRHSSMPHNASVFVASLPPDHHDNEISALLYEAFSVHGTVLNVKLLHDRGGGSSRFPAPTHGATCAFVQLETKEQAQAAIQGTHLTYIGDRVVRCEPAKAFRTLLISFRLRPSKSSTNAPNSFTHTHVRLRRPDPSSRFVKLTFDDQALTASPSPLQILPSNSSSSSPSNTTSPLDGEGLLLPLASSTLPNASILKSLCELFGPLEHFASFRVPSADETQGFPFAPHPPSEKSREGEDEEEGTTWEVKWEQRNDAVSACNALTHFSDFLITWAHGHPPAHLPSRFRYQSNTFSHPPNHQQHYEPRYPPRPYPTNSYRRPNENHIDSSTSAPVVPPPQVDLNDWGPSSPTTANNNTSNSWGDEPISKPPIPTEEDFPPLLESVGTAVVGQKGGKKYGKKGGWKKKVEGGGGESVVQTMAPTAPTKQVPIAPSPLPLPLPPSPISPLSPTTNTSFPTPSTLPPITPQSQSRPPPSFHHFSPARVDRFTLFVGGLDKSYEWTEEKLREIFEKYGAVEDVTIISTRATPKPGFAFVRMKDEEAAFEAVTREHNTRYDGRMIRVQLKEIGPIRRFSTNRIYNEHDHHHLQHAENNTEEPTKGLGLEGVTWPGADGEKSVEAAVVVVDSGISEPLKEEVCIPPTIVEEKEIEVVEEKEKPPVSVPPPTPAVVLIPTPTPTATRTPPKPASASSLRPPLSRTSTTHSETDKQTVVPASRRSSPSSPLPRVRSFTDPSSTMTKTLSANTTATTTVPSSDNGSSVGAPTWNERFGMEEFRPAGFGDAYGRGADIGGVGGGGYQYGGYGEDGESRSPGKYRNQGPWYPRPYAPYPAYIPAPLEPMDSLQQAQPPLRPTGFVQASHGMLVPIYPPEALNQYMTTSNKSNPPLVPAPPPSPWADRLPPGPSMSMWPYGPVGTPQPPYFYDWSAPMANDPFYPQMPSPIAPPYFPTPPTPRAQHPKPSSRQSSHRFRSNNNNNHTSTSNTNANSTDSAFVINSRKSDHSNNKGHGLGTYPPSGKGVNPRSFPAQLGFPPSWVGATILNNP